jgi:hypothetical protein
MFNKSGNDSVLLITITGTLSTEGYMFKDTKEAEKLLSPTTAMNELMRNGLNVKMEIKRAK